VIIVKLMLRLLGIHSAMAFAFPYLQSLIVTSLVSGCEDDPIWPESHSFLCTVVVNSHWERVQYTIVSKAPIAPKIITSTQQESISLSLSYFFLEGILSKIFFPYNSSDL
jgi:hypothetical protein